MYRNRLGLELAKLQSYQKPSEFLYVSYSNTKTKKPTGIDLVSNDNSVFGKKSWSETYRNWLTLKFKSSQFLYFSSRSFCCMKHTGIDLLWLKPFYLQGLNLLSNSKGPK